MDNRKKSVLHAIIKDYLSTGEPVGSRVVAKKYDLGVSPATIRNEMSDLEELGYIEQPHTSAGRMPSEKGYRYYIDNLMEREKLSEEEEEKIRKDMLSCLKEMNLLMKECCQTVSRLTNYAALIFSPGYSYGRLEKLQLLPLENNQLLLIIVSSTGMVRHCLMRIPENISREQLSKLEKGLQARLYDTDVNDLNNNLFAEVFREMALKQDSLKQFSLSLERALSREENDKFFFSGAFNMLSQPEFKNPDKIYNVLSFFEEDSHVKNLLTQTRRKGSRVIIGSEISSREMKDCSMVISFYETPNKKPGAVGVLGPIRMSYPKTISMIEFIAVEISALTLGAVQK